MTSPQPPFGGPAGYQPGTPPAGPLPTGRPTQPNAPAPQTPAPQAPAPKRGNLLTSRPAIGAAALVVGLALGAGSAGGGGATSAVPAASPAPTVTVTTTATATPSAPTTSESAEPEPEPSVEPEPEPEPEPTTAKPAKKSYKTLSSRKFKQFAKNPDAYLGKTYVIYGEVTQFDAATGTDTFRADTGPKKLKISYGYVDYQQNTMLTGDESELKELVEGDCFRAKVTVLGSYSYDTQIGGNTTVPLLMVDSVSVYGSTD